MSALSSSSPSVPVALSDVRETPIHRSFLSHPLFEPNVLIHVLQFCGPASADVVLEKTTSVAQTVAQIANVSIARDPQISPKNRGSQLRSKMDPLVRTYRQLNQPFQRVAHWRKELADFPDREARKERIKNMFKEAVQTRNYPLFRFWFENENLTDIRAYADVLAHSDGDGKFDLKEVGFVHSSMFSFVHASTIVENNKIGLFERIAEVAAKREDFASLEFMLHRLNFKNLFSHVNYWGILFNLPNSDIWDLVLNAIPKEMPFSAVTIDHLHDKVANELHRPDLAERIRQFPSYSW